MKPIETFPIDKRRQISYVLTDIDDTLTISERFPAVVFAAMEDLRQAGIRVIPIIGRPAGWCDHIARIVIFCGDSPNDSPMFGYFPHSVGVANVHAFEAQLAASPIWVTRSEGGLGFAEMVKVILDRALSRV